MFYFILFLLPFSCASDDFDNVSKNLFVSHYDCTKIQDNRMYSLNKVADFKITPENLYVTPATITLYQKNYRTDMAATMCSLKAHIFRYNCGMFSHSSYVHTQNSITYDLIVTPEICRQASKTNKIKISSLAKTSMPQLNSIQRNNRTSMMANQSTRPSIAQVVKYSTKHSRRSCNV